MKAGLENRDASEPKKRKTLMFTCLSGLRVNAFEDTWTLLANQGKGWRVQVGWVHSAKMTDDDRTLILNVFMFYAKTKAASTTSGVITNAGPYIKHGVPTLASLKTIWSGLKTNQKKGLNQFFSTLSNLGNKQFEEFHEFTSTRLDKNKRNALDPSKGALSEIEFDSLAKQINSNLREFDWTVERTLAFYQSSGFFSSVRNLMSNKLMLSIVRRPIQLSAMKWADAIPAGATFNDPKVSANDEIGTVGAQTLQLRVFIAKNKGSQSRRGFPERYPLHLSEDLSNALLKYKQFYRNGLTLLMKSSGITVAHSELTRLMNNMPVFPSHDLFSAQFGSLDSFKSFFTKDSTAYHVGEQSITATLRWVSFDSERTPDCMATSNRIRHTVLTRGAQDGLPVDVLAKITGVTVPAARHYIDLDYKSRKMVDTNYIGNEFLKRIFDDQITEMPSDKDCVVDNQFNTVGGLKNRRSCDSCSTVQGKPVGCYGCPNFRPILEANHRDVLASAQDKRDVNRNALINPLFRRSIEKLDKQIERIKYTIAVCDDILSKQRAIDVK
jgi:hypothetical protein